MLSKNKSEYKKNKNNFLKLFPGKFTIPLLGFALLILIGLPLSKNIKRQYNINNEIKELEQEISNLENQNLSLSELIDYIDSEQFTEKQARLNLNYKYDGEEVVVIKNKNEINNEQNSKKQTIYSQDDDRKFYLDFISGNYLKWRDYFFK